MHYTKLSVAGCAALMFGLLACSGEDGRDGINGTNGLNGADGTSCVVKSLNDATGYKILCGGDSVGVLLNGKTGATGKQGIAGPQGAQGADGKTGASCEVQSISDGYNVICGGKQVGVLKNGTNGAKGADGASCTTAPASTDGSVTIICGSTTSILQRGKDGTNCSATNITKNDRSGIEIACDGGFLDTLWNGESGKSCVKTDNGDGTIDVVCGDAEKVTLYKAMCGTTAYDPDKKFCVFDKLYDKCDGKTYKVNREYCDNGKVVELCGEYKKLRNDKYEFVKFRAVADTEFCFNSIITPKCNGKEFGVLEFCGKTKDGTKDSVYSYERCPNTSLSIDYMKTLLAGAYTKINKDLYAMLSSSSTEEEVDVTKPNVLKDMILEVGAVLDEYTNAEVTNFNVALVGDQDEIVGVQETCLSSASTATMKKCGTVEYDTTKKFCDIRDNRVYKFDTVKTATITLAWMTENLAFEYKLPKIVTETKVVEGKEVDVKSIDQVMGVVNYEDNVYENFEVNGVRYYTWKSAMGSWDNEAGIGDIRKTLLDAELKKLDSADRVIGACPDGWRLPTLAEFEELNDLGTSANNEDGYETLTKSDDPDAKTVNFNVNFAGYYSVSSNKVVNADKIAYFWSSSEDDVENQAYGLAITSTVKGATNSANKAYAFTIRCVKDIDD